MRNLPQKILLPRQEAKLQQLTQLAQLLLLRLRELPLQELRERKVLMDYLAAVDAAVKVDKWADKAAAAVKVDKVVVAVDKVVKAVE